MVLVAGINGAGKSTFYERYLQRLGMPFVNADVIARQEWPDDPGAHAYEAAAIAETTRAALLVARSSFVTETVFSHPSKLDLMVRARESGYRVLLIYIHLASSRLARLRVSERVERGGHAVPSDKIDARYPRLLKLLERAVRIANDVILYDNSVLDEPYRHIATLREGRLLRAREPLPDWAFPIVSPG